MGSESRPGALRIAVIGAGLMGYWHGRIARSLGAQVIGVVDVDSERAQRLAQILGAPSTASQVSTLFDSNNLDVVHICVPLGAHETLARQSIQRGLHCLVEKPLTQTVEETQGLFKLAGKKGIVLCPVHQVVFQIGVEKAARLLPDLGEVLAIDARICSAGGEGRSENALDGIIGEILPHPISVLRKLWPNSRLSSQCWSIRRTRSGEWLVSGAHAGALLSIAISMRARPTRFEMMIYCSRGALQVDFFHGFCVRSDGGVSRVRKIARPFSNSAGLFTVATTNLISRALRGEAAYPGLKSLVKAFYAAARGDGPPPVSAEDAIAVAAARDALLSTANVVSVVEPESTA
jgi:predicted dehydrogenase